MCGILVEARREGEEVRGRDSIEERVGRGGAIVHGIDWWIEEGGRKGGKEGRREGRREKRENERNRD